MVLPVQRLDRVCSVSFKISFVLG